MPRKIYDIELQRYVKHQHNTTDFDSAYVNVTGDTMTGDLALGSHIISAGGLMQKQSVASGVTLTIPSGYSMLVLDTFQIEGTLVIEGVFGLS